MTLAVHALIQNASINVFGKVLFFWEDLRLYVSISVEDGGKCKQKYIQKMLCLKKKDEKKKML